MTQQAFNNLEIKRLKALLKGRREEYEMFGMTPEDREQDIKIQNKIVELSKV